MKPIKFNTILERVSSRSDGSLSLTFSTPELKDDEKLTIFKFHKINANMTLEPLDEELDDITVVDSDCNHKTQSQRIRAVLFLLWKQEGEQGSFQDYYYKKTEMYIDHLKDKLV